MTRTARLHVTGLRQAGASRLDIGDALDLLASAVGGQSYRSANVRHRRHPVRDELHSIVERALFQADVTAGDLSRMRGHRLRDLYRDGGLPINLTLGALIVFDAAEQSEAHGSGADDVLTSAVAAAAKFLDLVALLPADLVSSAPPSDTSSQKHLKGAVVGH